MLEPVDSQEAYEFTLAAFEISECWKIPVILRLTTRVCHSKTVVRPREAHVATPPPHFRRDIPARVMIPAYAKPAHHRLRQKMEEIAAWNEREGPYRLYEGDPSLGIIATGIAAVHAREAAPEARMLVVGMTYPLPMQRIRGFAASVDRLVVIEEGDPVLEDSLRAAGISADGKPEMYRFGELNVARVRRILAGDTTPEPAPPKGKPPELCQGCSHRDVSKCCATWAASSRATSGAIRSVSCRRSRPWTPACAWARASAWASACATSCRTTRQSAW